MKPMTEADGLPNGLRHLNHWRIVLLLAAVSMLLAGCAAPGQHSAVIL